MMYYKKYEKKKKGTKRKKKKIFVNITEVRLFKMLEVLFIEIFTHPTH